MAAVQLSDLLVEPGDRTEDGNVRHDPRDRQRCHRWRRDAQLCRPGGQLRRRVHEDDAPKPYPAVCRGAHGAVLAGGEHSRPRAIVGRQVRRSPPGKGEFRVACTVAGSYPVPVLLKCGAVLGHQDGAERLVTRLERLLRELDAPAKVTPVGLAQIALVQVDCSFLLGGVRHRGLGSRRAVQRDDLCDQV